MREDNVNDHSPVSTCSGSAFFLEASDRVIYMCVCAKRSLARQNDRSAAINTVIKLKVLIVLLSTFQAFAGK